MPELVEEIEKWLTVSKTGKLRALAAAISRLAHKWSEDQWS